MAIELELEAEVDVDVDVAVVDTVTDDAANSYPASDPEAMAELQELAYAEAAEAEAAEAELDAEEVGTQEVGDAEEVTGAPSLAATPATPLTPPSFDIDSSALDLLSQIANAELRCKRAEWVVIERKEALKEAKEEFDGCVAELRKIAAQAKNDSQRPLFNVVVDAGSAKPATPIATDVAPDAGTITSDAVLPEEAVIAVDDSSAPTPSTTWKSTSIDELDDLTPATLEALRRGDIATLGELSDLIARCDGASSDYWPKGIGKKKQQQIIESLLTWKENNGELGTADTSIPVTLPTWEALSVEEQQVYLEQRRERLAGKTCAELDALYPTDHPQHGTFAQGKEDQSNDDMLINCPCSPDTNGDWSFVDAWIAGWLWGDRQLDGSDADAAG